MTSEFSKIDANCRFRWSFRCSECTALLYIAGTLLLLLPTRPPASSALASAPIPSSAKAARALSGASLAGGVPVDIVVLTLSTLGAAAERRRALAAFSAEAATTVSTSARLLFVVGGSADDYAAAEVSSLAHPPAQFVRAPCADAHAAGAFYSGGTAAGWHAECPATCKLMEGLCGAVAGGPFTFVAVVHEGSLFRWARFMQHAPPPRGLVWGDTLHRYAEGLPPLWEQPYWPPTIRFNASFVLGGDVARALCTLHRAGTPLQLFGPPELFLARLLATLEGIERHTGGDEGSNGRGGGSSTSECARHGCPASVLCSNMSARAWQDCEASAFAPYVGMEQKSHEAIASGGNSSG